MAGEISASFDGDRFKAAMKMDGFYDLLLTHVGKYLDKWVRNEIGRKRFHGTLQRRTGTLSRAFRSWHHGSSVNSLRFITGTQQEVPYASIHEFGGVIHAKPGKFLTIPLGAAKNLSGVAKFSARAAMEEEDVFIVKTKRALMIVRKRPTRWEPLFLLVKSVKIPARLGFYSAFDRQMPQLIRQFEKAVDEALRPPTRVA